MANELIPPEQMAKELLAIVEKAAKGNKKVMRAIWYDLQTVLGKFPAERKKKK